jgi:hypothetical protein
MVATWTVLHLPDGHGTFVNDRGFISHRDKIDGEGWIIPLDWKHVLALIPAPRGYARTIMIDVGSGDWRAAVDHLWLTPDTMSGLNEAITDSADKIIAGEKDFVLPYANRIRDLSNASAPSLRPMPSPQSMRAHDLDWHSAVSSLRYSHDDRVPDRFDIDPVYLARGWCAPLFVQVPPVAKPPSLQMHGRAVDLHWI